VLQYSYYCRMLLASVLTRNNVDLAQGNYYAHPARFYEELQLRCLIIIEEVDDMYFVDRDKLETTLVFLEKQISLFSSQDQWSTRIEKAALERITHLMIESVLDVGNAVIDGFIMRDPGSYEDIIDILIDERVVSAQTGKNLKILIQHRKVLVQLYTEINHSDLQKQFSSHLETLALFPKNVRDYLQNELGPVSAFN
jgi:uncharacterized protein YutE (UPF0331/DUF86 family)